VHHYPEQTDEPLVLPVRLTDMRTSGISSAFRAFLFTFALVTGGFFVASANQLDDDLSPRIAALGKQPSKEALAGFWSKVQGQAPLVETVEADRELRRVTFLWRGSNDTRRVSILGGLPGANLVKP